MVIQFHNKLHTISNKTNRYQHLHKNNNKIDDDSNNEAESVRNSILVWYDTVRIDKQLWQVNGLRGGGEIEQI